MIPVFILAACLIAFGPAVAFSADVPPGADPSPSVRDAFAEISEELNACYGYYLIGGQCAENSNATDVVEENKKLEAYVLDLVVQTGTKGGVNPLATMAFLRLSMQSMKKDIQNSCANLPILIEKHAPSCKALVTNMESRFSQILAEQSSKRH